MIIKTGQEPAVQGPRVVPVISDSLFYPGGYVNIEYKNVRLNDPEAPRYAEIWTITFGERGEAGVHFSFKEPTVKRRNVSFNIDKGYADAEPDEVEKRISYVVQDYNAPGDAIVEKTYDFVTDLINMGITWWEVEI